MDKFKIIKILLITLLRHLGYLFNTKDYNKLL